METPVSGFSHLSSLCNFHANEKGNDKFTSRTFQLHLKKDNNNNNIIIKCILLYKVY